MPSTLLEELAVALQARAATPADQAERHRAAVLLADHLGCRAAGGAVEPAPPWAVSLVERACDDAVAARRTDRDDVHWPSLTHPGSVVWPVVTELGADTGAPGPLRLAAALTGYAATAGLAAALGPGHAASFHTTATAGTLGAAAAAAVLLRLPATRWPHALGHALSAMGGSRGAVLEGSPTRCFHSAHAIRTGIAATVAAGRGLDATTGDLDRRQGALAGLDPDRLVAGDQRALAQSSLRVFATSGWNQAAYEAARGARLASRGPVVAVVVRTPAAAPPGVAEAVAAAIAAADGGRAAEDLLGRVEVRPHSGLTAVLVEAAEESAEVAVEAPLDHPSRPATLDQLATLKWHRPATESADHVARLAADLAGEESP